MEEQKAWMRGYELSHLKEIEAFYSGYNAYAMSPFNSFKKNNVAEGLHDKSLHFDGDVAFTSKISKSASPINMYHDVVIGNKQKGDCTVKNLTWKKGCRSKAIVALKEHEADKPCWFYVWTEDELSKEVALKAGFSWVGTKITTFAELYGIYFRASLTDNSLFDIPRIHPGRLSEEDLSLEKLSFEDVSPLIGLLLEQIQNLDLDFTNHYSNYNKNGAWSALSLRGYTPDPEFITKPVEMNKKWKEEHANEIFEMQDTKLRINLSSVELILKLIPSNFHRIRIMRLAPGGGELERHTDQVDPDSGIKDGKVMRLHFPIVTNDSVMFTTWNVDGIKKEIHMKRGECWYLDTRKPHRAINTGKTDRLHLVVDVDANDNIRGLL
jgi:hypothetical protein